MSGCTSEISDGKVIVKNVTSNTTCNINVSYMKLYDKLLADNPTRSTRDTYDAGFTSDTTGTLFTATEKNVHNTTDTTVYYYAGNTTNNWVKFAGYYWRIIRTNADGSVRILYSGTSHDTTSGYLSTGTSAFNSSYNSPKYVGYMYGENDDTLANARTNTTDSTIKTAIDNWYAGNMTSYTKYLSTTAVYCNDRNLNTGSEYGATFRDNFHYAPSGRARSTYKPTYDCTEVSDAFSVDNTSAKLTYPIALMTGDEIMRAGGKYGSGFTSPYAWFYLNSADGSITGLTYWWLLSPHHWRGDYAYVLSLHGSNGPGQLDLEGVPNANGVRPVISLKSNVLYKSGDGSANSPYEILETPDTISDVVKANAVNENGYRYEGSDPNNYIQMQKSDGTTELWRIIGLFPDGENGEEVIRVRRHYEQGRFPTGAFDLNGNLWQDSTLYTNLKNDYNTSNYSGTVKFKMYLGTSSSFESYTSSDLYNMERLLNSKGTASSYANGVTSYVGEVGLIYPSDYGYAAQASDCLRIVKPNSYGSNSTCYTKNWLYQGSSTLQWIISPEYYTKYSVITIYTDGNLTEYNDSYDYLTPGDNGAYSPVMALSSEITISGTGTVSDPYVMK